jgi:hypothetical protein
MYKCGWNGCEKAYGTLNHLNAHVTMQSHGAKRTPEGMFISPCFSLDAPKSRARLASMIGVGASPTLMVFRYYGIASNARS